MKKYRLSRSTVILTAIATSLFLIFIVAKTSPNTSTQALAAPLKRIAPVPLQTEIPNLNAAEIVEVFSGTREAEQAEGWVIEYADAPHLPYSTDHSLRLDANGNAHTVYGSDHLYYAWEDGDSWQVKIVDEDPTVGLHASLDLDPQGFAHISYYDEPNHALKYAYQDESGWHTMVVDPEVQNNYGTFIDTSLAVDAQGYPHISYCNLMGGYRSDLKYAYQDPDGWHIELVESGNEGQNNSLALDSDGHPYISYTHDEEYYGEGRRLKFAYKIAESWHYEIVDNNNKGNNNSLVMDINGNAHLSYYVPNSGLYYGFWDTTGWYTRTLDSLGNNSSIAVDLNGNPHISYGGTTLKYAYTDANNWYTTTIELEGEPTGFSSSITLDHQNHPHIKYADNSDFVLKHGHFDGSTWQSETIDSNIGSASEFTFFSSLILDPAGYPHISYTVNNNLKYAQRDSDGWNTEVVTEEGRAGYGSLAMDGDGYFHIGYVDDTTDSLNYAYQDNDGWHTQIVNVFTCLLPGDCGWYESGTVYHTSLALDHDGKAHISYYVVAKEHLFDNTIRELHYTSGTGATDIWPWETFKREYNLETDGSHTSLALDNAGNPHISFYLGSENELRYAYKHHVGEDLVWAWETVDDDGDVGIYTSLELDQNDDAHISYYDKENEDLKYASLGTSGWVTHTIDSEGMVGRYTSLDLDNAGYPHISYYDESNADLKYAHHDGSTWHTVTVDSEGNVGKFTSLYLDAKGFPHISYYDESNQDLKYAYYTDVLPTQTPSPTTTPPTPVPGDGMKLFLPLTLRD